MKFFIFLLIIQKRIESQFYHQDIAVIYDNEDFKNSHSTAFEVLKDYTKNGIDFISISNSSAKIVEYNRRLYDHVFIILNKKSKWNIPSTEILQFADLGGNIFFNAGPSSSAEAIKIIEEFGFVMRSDEYVYDSFSNLNTDETDNLKTIKIDLSKYSVKSEAIFPKKLFQLNYKGRGFGLINNNPSTFSIIKATESSFLASQDMTIPRNAIAFGSNIVLVGGVEMRNQARVVVTGSSNLFEDKIIFDSSNKNDNFDVFLSLCDWVFQKSGVLRIKNPQHKLVSTQETPEEYIVETEIEYSIEIETLDRLGNWVPFVADDVQIELFRLSPFGRVTYNHTKNGIYTARFYLPDYIGTFGLWTKYKKTGYTTLDHQVKILIRPRRHNDYERFIFGAWPYYLTSFGIMGLTFCLVFILLNQQPPKEKTS